MEDKRIIRKYSNRRLYDVSLSRHVTLADLASMIRQGVDFKIEDAKSGEDLTCSVLTQIIASEENRGHNLLPESFLRRLIAFYDGKIPWFLPRYLELIMENYEVNHKEIRLFIEDFISKFASFNTPEKLRVNVEQVSKNNVELMREAMKIFFPFSSKDFKDFQGQDSGLSQKVKDMEEEILSLRKELQASKSA